MIENCPNCGKQPEWVGAESRGYWRHCCDGNLMGVIISGPTHDSHDGEKWNAMVLRMQGATIPGTLKSAPAYVAVYPERVAKLRKENGRLKSAVRSWETRESAYITASEERDEWKARAEKAEAELAEKTIGCPACSGLGYFADGVGADVVQMPCSACNGAGKVDGASVRFLAEAYQKKEAELAVYRTLFLGLAERCNDAQLELAVARGESAAAVVGETSFEPRQNWNDVRDSPVGTRLVSDEIDAKFPGGYIEKIENHDPQKAWRQCDVYENKIIGVYWEDQHNWRTLPRMSASMTWAQLNAIAKPGDKATCGAFVRGRFIEREENTSYLDSEFNWTYSERRNFDPLVEWKSQIDWRILPRDANA